MGDESDTTKILKKGDSETLKIEKEKAKAQQACLIIIRGTPQGKRFELTKTRMFIGRDVQADIPLNDHNISRKHAEVFKEKGEVRLKDNGSTNGTFVNDKQIKQAVTLRKEDMIKVGNTILKYLPQGELEIFYYGTLESAAHTDPLTKTYNKGYIMEAFEAEFKRAKALHQDLSILILDLDHFKNINDTYGHDAGDFVLKEMCEVVRTKALLKTSVFGRFGGEEFLILLPNTSLKSALTVGETIRGCLENHSFVYENKQLLITASIGAAEIAPEVDSHIALFKQADQAVYQAKSSGRNRVCSK